MAKAAMPPCSMINANMLDGWSRGGTMVCSEIAGGSCARSDGFRSVAVLIRLGKFVGAKRDLALDFAKGLEYASLRS
jgi:hypothetical protein